MILAMIAAQFGLPLAAVFWLLVWPQRSLLAFALQALAGLAIILGSALVAIWTMIPQWSMAVLALLWAVACWRGYRAIDSERKRPSAPGWASMLIAVPLAAGGLWLAREAQAGRHLPPGPVIDLAMPLDGSNIMVANGGSRLPVNAHQDVLDLTVPRHRLWTGQAYGVDFVALSRLGTSSDGLRPADPRRYVIFGRAVKAPCAGTITAVFDGRPDLDVPEVDPEVMHGNFILLRCGETEIALAHLQSDSVAVRVGQQVRIGQTVGRVGNSGYSDEPHLHINAQTPGTKTAPFSGQPVAMRFNRRFLARNDKP
jgi:Peptidase family M23